LENEKKVQAMAGCWLIEGENGIGAVGEGFAEAN